MSEREALVKGLGKAHIEMIRRQWDQDLYPCNAEFYALCNMALAAISTPQQEPVVHPDDAAIDKFAAAMKAKMAKKRAEGRSGWDDPEQCTIDYLTRLFHDHVHKGDPVDIGNFAMMLWHRISATSLPAQYRRIPAPQPDGVVVPRDLFDELQWGSSHFDSHGYAQSVCPVCEAEQRSGHRSDCRVAAPSAPPSQTHVRVPVEPQRYVWTRDGMMSVTGNGEYVSSIIFDALQQVLKAEIHKHEITKQLFDEELADGDKLCSSLCFERTEGGRLPVRKMVADIGDVAMRCKRAEAEIRNMKKNTSGTSGEGGQNPVVTPTKPPDREHELSRDCWCQPIVDGAAPDGIDLDRQIVRMRGEVEHCKELHGDGSEWAVESGSILASLIELRDLRQQRLDTGGWMPIETAPRDKTMVALIHHDRAYTRYGVGWWMPMDGWQAWGKGYDDYLPPTHWKPLLPLPALPKEK